MARSAAADLYQPTVILTYEDGFWRFVKELTGGMSFPPKVSGRLDDRVDAQALAGEGRR